MTNVIDGDGPVKPSGSDSAPDSAARPIPSGREALEISRLLVEVLQLGHMQRRAGGEAGSEAAHVAAMSAAAGSAGSAGASAGPAGGPPSPIASHVIRAAIHIYANGPRTITELATGLAISQGWASRVVDEMEKAGYVERQRDEADRRVVRVRLSPMAIARVEMAYDWRGDAVEAALEGMSPDERAAVAAFLRRFVEAARVTG